MEKLKHYLFILLLLCLATVTLYRYLSRQDEEPLSSFGSAQAVLSMEAKQSTSVFVIAVDIGVTGKLTASNIVSGNSSFLGFQSAAKAQVIDGVLLLGQIDKDKNGVIDINDPEYKSLEVMTFTRGGKSLKTLSLRGSGIRLISINPQVLAQPEEAEKNAPRIVGYAIIADGSRRDLWLVSVPMSYFTPTV